MMDDLDGTQSLLNRKKAAYELVRKEGLLLQEREKLLQRAIYDWFYDHFVSGYLDLTVFLLLS